MLPRNASPILIARQRDGRRPYLPIVVSFVGDIGWDNPQVFADAGVEYDWRFLHDLFVYIAVKPGLEVRDAIAAIFAESRPYPTLVDVVQKRAASVIAPRRLWRWAPHAKDSKELFV